MRPVRSLLAGVVCLAVVWGTSSAAAPARQSGEFGPPQGPTIPAEITSPPQVPPPIHRLH